MTLLTKRKATPRGENTPERLPVTPNVIKKLFAYSGTRYANPSYKQELTSVETQPSPVLELIKTRYTRNDMVRVVKSNNYCFFLANAMQAVDS